MTTLVTKGESKKKLRFLLEMRKESSLKEAMQSVSEKKSTTKRPSQDGNNEDFIVVVCEANMVDGDVEWWIDSSATRHIAQSTSFFKTYEEDNSGEVLFMGNSSTTKVKEGDSAADI